MKIVKTEDFTSTMNLPKKTIPVDGELVKRQNYFLEKIRDENRLKKVLKKNETCEKKYKLANFPISISDVLDPTVVFNQILKDIYIRHEILNGNIVDDIITFVDRGVDIKNEDEDEKSNDKNKKVDKKKVSENIKAKQIATNEVLNNLKIQINEVNKLGTVLDYNHHYDATTDGNVEATIIDKFLDLYKKKKIYRNFRPIYWCTKCKESVDKSNVKYKKEFINNYYITYNVKSDKKEILKEVNDVKNVYVIANTILPWTMISSEWIAVAKETEYSLVQVLEKDKKTYYIMASNMVEEFMMYKFFVKYVVIKKLSSDELINLECFNPLNYNKTVKILSTNEKNVIIDKKNTSGIRIVSSGHTYLDYLIHKDVNKYKLKCVLNPDGTTNSLAIVYNNLNYNEVNSKIVKFLKDNNFIFFSNKVEVAIAYCKKCNEKLVYRSISEWYLKNDTDITGEQYEKIISNMSASSKYKNEELKSQIEKINNTKEIIISDRKEIGIPIPVFYCAECGSEIAGDKINQIVGRIFREKGSNFWYKSNPEEILQGQVGCQKCGGTFLFKDDGSLNELFKDVSIPFIKDKESNSSNICIESKERFNNKLKLISFSGEIDETFGNLNKIMIHSVVDENMKKIDQNIKELEKKEPNNKSKNKPKERNTKVNNNITIAENEEIKSDVAIQKVINNYGTDILRLWTISKSNDNYIRLNDQYMINTKKTYMKIRRTFKFLLSNLTDFNPTRNYISAEKRVDIDKLIYAKLSNLCNDVEENYDSFNLKKVYDLLVKFCNNDLCNEYFETIKYRLYVLKQNDEIRRSTQSTLYDIIMNLVVFFEPIIPFTLEEIWPYIWHSNEDEANNILIYRRKIENIELNVEEETKKWNRIYKLKNNVKKYISSAKVSGVIKDKIEATLIVRVNNEEAKKFIEDNYEDIRATLGISKIEVEISDNQGFEIKKSEGAQCRRCRQYSIYIGRNLKYTYLCPKCAEILES